jgi:hypothetical protein
LKGTSHLRFPWRLPKKWDARAAAIESDLQKAQALVDMGISRGKAGKLAEAREMLIAASQAAHRVIPAKRKGGWPSRFEKAAMLGFIAREQAKAGDVKEALRTADTIPTNQAMDDALAGIAPAQAKEVIERTLSKHLPESKTNPRKQPHWRTWPKFWRVRGTKKTFWPKPQSFVSCSKNQCAARRDLGKAKAKAK